MLDAAPTAELGDGSTGCCGQRSHRPARQNAQSRAAVKRAEGNAAALQVHAGANGWFTAALAPRARRVLDAASTADAKGITAIVEEQPLISHVKGMPFQAQRLLSCRCAYFMGRAA